MSDEQSECQERGGGVMVARGDLIALAAAVSVLCGALVPVPAWLLDVVWGCSLCLSTALVLISLAGKDPVELSGFGPLMILGAVVRTGLGAAAAGLVFRDRIAGTLIETVGSPLSAAGPVWVLLVLPAAAGLASSLVIRSAGRISTTALKCLTETIPDKQGVVELDEQAGWIRPQQVQERKGRLLRQSGFFLNMGGAAKLLRCEAVVAAVAMLGIIVGELVVYTVRDTTSALALEECAAAAAGAGVLMLVPMLLVAIGAAHLSVRSCHYLELSRENGRRPKGAIIEIVSQETGRREQVELLNPDFLEVSEGTRAVNSAAEHVVELEPRETVDVREGPHSAQTKRAITACEEYYEDLAACVAGLQAGKKFVLFAAETRNALPVTVAVNVGIRLARGGLRTLLIDAGPGREALAAVFDANFADMRGTPVKTCVKHLHLWRLQATEDTATTVEAAVREVAGDYDRVILYAPDLPQDDHGRVIAEAVTSAVVFGSDLALGAFLVQAGCTTIEHRAVLDVGANGLSEHI